MPSSGKERSCFTLVCGPAKPTGKINASNSGTSHDCLPKGRGKLLHTGQRQQEEDDMFSNWKRPWIPVVFLRTDDLTRQKQ
jgi:hypothetical protein